jgi:hypothetical protein
MPVAGTERGKAVTEYPVILGRSADGGFVLRIPALSLIAEAARLEDAWVALEALKADLIERHRRIGALDDLPRPTAPEPSPDQRDLRRFAIKAAIVAATIGLLISVAAFSFAYAVREPLRKAGLKLGRTAIAQVEEGLRQAATAELTPARQQELRRLVAEAAPALRPYVRELRPILSEACSN